MIKDTNNRLEKAQNELSDANQRIQELENKETDTEQMEELYRIRAELDMNLSFLSNLCGKTLASLKSYTVLADGEDIKKITEKLGNIKELKQLVSML